MRLPAAAARAALLLGIALPPLAARAQEPDPLESAIGAYRDLEFDSAASRLRLALARSGAEALGATSRSRALAYLGATELFRERRDSAAAAFRSLLQADPRYRLDQLIFPPEVLTLYEQVRLGTRVVRASVASRTELAGGARLVIRLYAASYHDIAVAVTRAGNRPFRTLYSGAIGDSLELLWDGRDSTGVPADSGRYLLQVASRATDGTVSGTFRLPLHVATAGGDTLPHPRPPPDSTMLPELTRPSSPIRSLLIGVAAAATVAALPSLVADGADGTAARFGVAASIGAAGVAGFVTQGRARPIPENVASNQARRRVWERQVADIIAENRRRLAAARLVIVAGEPLAAERQ